MSELIVTIDGLSASGKSSVAGRVAATLGIPYVSSGLLYRGVAYQALRHGISPHDAHRLLELLKKEPPRLIPGTGTAGNRVLVGPLDITESLHTAEVDAVVSVVARHPGIRAYVNASLRALPAPFVAEGRDMGTAVFKRATHKFYLFAPTQVRARRRAHQRGAGLSEVEAALRTRDHADTGQSPPATDAIMLDTTNLDLTEVVEAILSRVEAPQNLKRSQG